MLPFFCDITNCVLQDPGNALCESDLALDPHPRFLVIKLEDTDVGLDEEVLAVHEAALLCVDL